MIRLLRNLVLFIVLGIVTTIAIAWCCSAWVRVWDVDRVVTGVTSNQERTWLVKSYVRSGASWISATPIWDLDLFRHGRYSQGGWQIDANTLTTSKIVNQAPDPAIPFDWKHYVSVRGWPWPALYGETPTYDPVAAELEYQRKLKEEFNAPKTIVEDTKPLKVIKPIVDIANRPFPIWPIWDGFAADSGLYAFIWLMIWVVFFPVSRAIRFRGVIFRAIVAALLGVVSTVAVAWGCAWWVDVQTGRTWKETLKENQTSDTSTYIQHTQTWGTKRSSSQVRRFPFPLIDSAANTTTVSDSFGWPALAMKCSVTISFDLTTRKQTTSDDKSVLRLNALLGSVEDSPKLPLGIRAGGFAIDSVSFALAWYLLFGIAAIPICLRQFRRRGRGQCIWCGYDLRGSRHNRCTECGVQISRIFQPGPN